MISFLSFLTLVEKFIGKKEVNFNSHLKTFYEEFRVEFYIKIKPIESKIIYLLYIIDILYTLDSASNYSAIQKLKP
jgi:hypothetical protein